MLAAAGDGVAMANATDGCKAAADHVTLSCSESGVARYLDPLLSV
jgi:hydroxymethylpyrimidine pyrophosphatase-like HAD family hydrolase